VNPFLAVAGATVAVVVGVLVLRAGRTRIGCLLLAHGVCFAAPALDGEGTSSVGLVVDQLASGAWVFIFLWLALVGYLVPDGHAASPFWRRWVRWGLVGVVAFLVGAAGDVAGFRDAHGGVDPPLPWLPGPVSGLLGVGGLLATVLLLVGSPVAVLSRLRRASGDTRLQLLWLVWGATSVPAALGLMWLGHFVLDDDPVLIDGALLLAGVALPLAIGVAILRHRLFDIEAVLSRTLVYGLLVASVVTVYAGLLLGADLVLGNSSWGGVLAVGVVAVAVHPAHGFLRARIERWVYGYRSDPAAALRRLSGDVESADPLDAVDTITASVADALKVQRAWVEVPDVRADDGPRTVRVPMVHRGDLIGHLAVEVPAGRTMSSADTALLRDLARHAAVTVRAAQLAAQLQASRSQIVTAREEERKRLRRDLHDGVGPSLAAILLKLGAAQSRTDADERNALLAEVRKETKAAISEVRRAVEDLRPPALDEVGLLGAVRQRAASLTTGTLVYRVQGPEVLPPLPAAVEVAAFRIASEAMTNVARHSGASMCSVDLVLDGTLGVSVSDNGRGSDAPTGTSVGWRSMIQRAAELGGSCTIARRAEGGLVVRALLPLGEVAEAEVLR
jgi:signal transduction histidine kinase